VSRQAFLTSPFRADRWLLDREGLSE
jgi:hypothetical protein